MWRAVALCVLLLAPSGCAAGALAKDGREQEERRNAQRQERNDRFEEIKRRCEERLRTEEDEQAKASIEEACNREIEQNLPAASRKSHQVP